MILQMTKLKNFFKLGFKELNNTKKADTEIQYPLFLLPH